METRAQVWRASGIGAIAIGLLLAACSSDGGSGTATDSGGDATESATEPSDGSGNDTTAAGGETGSSVDVDATSTADDSGTNDTDTDTAGEEGTRLRVIPSSVAVLENDDAGALTVRCVVTADGLPVAGGEAAVISVSPARGVTETDGVFTFEEFGVFEVACEAEVEGEVLSATQTVAILNEAIDPVAARLGAGIGTTLDGISAIIEADGLDDALMLAAVERLEESLPLLAPESYAEFDDMLRYVPGGYPEGADLEKMGITANDDDQSLPAALDSLASALADYEAVVSAFDPDDPTQQDADALEAAGAELSTAIDTLTELEPTAHGLVASRVHVATLIRDDVAPMTHMVATWVGARTRSEADGVFSGLVGEPDPQGFGLLSLSIGMFGQNNLQIQALNRWYAKYIAQLDESINNFILAGGINYFLPLVDNPPTIEFLVASASASFASPGYPSWIDGHGFNEDPEMNHVLVFGDSWQGVIDNIFQACGVDDVDTMPEKLWVLHNCINDIDEAIQSIFVTPLSVGPGMFGSVQGIDIGEFPAVCSGGLPTATFLLPINYDVGRGEPYFVNCI